jgi:hypothetical protein
MAYSDMAKNDLYGVMIRDEISANWDIDEAHEFLVGDSNEGENFFTRFQDAKAWAIENGAEMITRSPCGFGFLVKRDISDLLVCDSSL